MVNRRIECRHLQWQRNEKKLLSDYSTILFGSSLYAGRSKAAHLLVKHFEQIKNKKVVLFTSGNGRSRCTTPFFQI